MVNMKTNIEEHQKLCFIRYILSAAIKLV